MFFGNHGKPINDLSDRQDIIPPNCHPFPQISRSYRGHIPQSHEPILVTEEPIKNSQLEMVQYWENPPFIVHFPLFSYDFPSFKPPLTVDFPGSHVWFLESKYPYFGWYSPIRSLFFNPNYYYPIKPYKNRVKTISKHKIAIKSENLWALWSGLCGQRDGKPLCFERPWWRRASLRRQRGRGVTAARGHGFSERNWWFYGMKYEGNSD